MQALSQCSKSEIAMRHSGIVFLLACVLCTSPGCEQHDESDRALQAAGKAIVEKGLSEAASKMINEGRETLAHELVLSGDDEIALMDLALAELDRRQAKGVAVILLCPQQRRPFSKRSVRTDDCIISVEVLPANVGQKIAVLIFDGVPSETQSVVLKYDLHWSPFVTQLE